MRGQATFAANGALQAVTWLGGSVTFAGAMTQTIVLDLGSTTSNCGTGLDGLTQFDAPSSINTRSQNGQGRLDE